MKNSRILSEYLAKFFLVSLFFATGITYSQTPIDLNSLNASYQSGSSLSETSLAKMLCGASTINCGEAYTDTYLSSDGINQGDLVLNPTASFTLSGTPYSLRFSTDDVSYQRVANTIATTTGVDLIQYEYGNIVNVGEPNNTISILPNKTMNSEDALGDQIINNGAESIFHNFRTSFQSVNTDVERIDVIFNALLKTSTPENAGFLIAERGGNDNIKVAAITSLSISGKPSAYGTLASINIGDWAVGINRSLKMISYISDNNGINYGPFASNSAQSITANFMSLQDLGIASEQVIYGYSIFPGDVDPAGNPSHDLVDPETFPKNTASANGGLDLVYASGAFDNDGKLKHVIASSIPSLSTYGILFLSLILLTFGAFTAKKSQVV